MHGLLAVVLPPVGLWWLGLVAAKALIWLGFEDAGWAVLRGTWWLRQRLYRRPS
jgi:hypothetical protein